MKKERLTPKVRVNLGCGSRIIPGWVNIDGFYEAEGVTKGDMRSIPLESGTVDYLLCDNALEHIPMADVPIVLQEIRRVLKVGGRAVIIVPEFTGIAQQWLDAKFDLSFNPYFYKYLSETIYGGQVHPGEFHFTPFCQGFMNYSLQMCGLRKYLLVLHPAFSEAPNYPGTETFAEVRCRNAQLVADITKEA